MGWGRYFFLGDFGQQLDLADQKDEIENLRNELRRSRGSSKDVTQDIKRLQAENDELRLYLTAVVRLLISQGIVSQKQMRQVVEAIDAEDGVQDGRYQGKVE
jgi:hypothetical protein